MLVLVTTVRSLFIRAGQIVDIVYSRFQIVITGGTSGLVETITDAVSIHSIKKAQYARRLAEGRLGQVTLLDHFISVSNCHAPWNLLDSKARPMATHPQQNSLVHSGVLFDLWQVRGVSHILNLF